MTVQQSTLSSFASVGVRLYSVLSSVRGKARKLVVPETAFLSACMNKSATVFVLQFIASSGEGVHRDQLALVSGIERERLDQILDRLFRQGKIMVDFGGVYRKTALRIDP